MADQLPVHPTPFIGRRDELAALRHLCARSRLVTVTGLGGIGKTRIALHAAAAVADGFDDGVHLVELHGLQDADLLVQAVATSVHVTDHTTRPQHEVLADHLADRRVLLVLDTCEHLVEACARLAGRLLAAAPGLHILATSRQPLGVRGEKILTVAPMSVHEDAVQLFAQRARAADPGFELTARTRPTAERICARLDGIPLAIELAAGRLRGERPEELLALLDDRFQLAAAEPRHSSRHTSRHSTLRTTIGWSHELCPPAERLLWARLSVFAGSFHVQAAEEVCADDALDRADVPRLLTALADKSLLVREHGPDGEQFRQLDTVRAYGAEWLRRLGDEHAARVRHLAWCQTFAERGEAAWFGPGQAAVFRATRSAHAQLVAALDFALSTPGQERAGARLAGTLWFYWVGCGLLGDGRFWLDRALTVTSGLHRDRLKALWVNGYVAILQGDARAAESLLTRCRAGALRGDDDTAYAYATHRMGCAALMRDEHATAERHFRASLASYAALGELDSNVMMARIELAMALAFQGDLTAAVALCEEARATCETHGERWAKAYALYVLAFAAWAGDRGEEAARLARECLVINYEFRDLVGTVLPVEVIALLWASRGDHEQAAALHGAARRIWDRVGLPLFGSVYFNAPHDTAVVLAREGLGDQGYAAAFERGSGLGLDETVALALGLTVVAG
ncbi:NB-ARC domain-containing protein [Streptomyces sp. NPDC052225]|uniref:ATP-binding protein n=1 Tax=Streptomyces sp. NPDC052225 TaxID=3154949 RepID=UPI00342FDE32